MQMQHLDGSVMLVNSLPLSPIRSQCGSGNFEQSLILEKSPLSLELSPLKTLPLEIIRYIAGLLPLSDAASFTLTSQTILSILGGQYLSQLSQKGQKSRQVDRLKFLDLLERDLPRYVLCYECHNLHGGIKYRHDNLSSGELLRQFTVNDCSTHASYFIHERFSAITYQLAMKLHRHGLDCSEHLSLLTGIGHKFVTGCNCQWESAPRIVNGQFLLRHQTWLLFPVGWEVRIPDQQLVDVCPHWRFPLSNPTSPAHSIIPSQLTRPLQSTRLQRKLACRASHWDDATLNSTCASCSGLFQCKKCPTEFQLDVKDFHDDGVALVLTRWLDLGEGRTRLDPKYLSHTTSAYNIDESYKPAPFEAGSIRAAYEGKEFDLDEILTPKHKASLFSISPRRRN